MEISITIPLHKDTATGKKGGVSHNNKGMTDIWKV